MDISYRKVGKITTLFFICLMSTCFLSACNRLSSPLGEDPQQYPKTTPPLENPESPEQIASTTIIATGMKTTETPPPQPDPPMDTETPVPTDSPEVPIYYNNTICEDCLLPMVVKNDYEEDVFGFNITFSFGIDSSVTNDIEYGITNLYFDTEHRPEGPQLFAETIMKMHHVGWLNDHPGSGLTFEQYMEMVKNGQGKYTSRGSVDNHTGQVPWREGKDYQTITIDPSKNITFLVSNEQNPLFISDYYSTWTTIDGETGDVVVRFSGPYILGLTTADGQGKLDFMWGLEFSRNVFYLAMRTLIADEQYLNPNSQGKVGTNLGTDETTEIARPITRLSGPDGYPVITSDLARDN